MTWRPAGARLWRPGQVTQAQRAEIDAMIAFAVAARQHPDAAERAAEHPAAPGIPSPAPVPVRPAAAVLARQIHPQPAIEESK